MIDDLPPEIVLQILSYLPFSSLRSAQLVSKSMDALFQRHESAIFREAAKVHMFDRCDDAVEDWKGHCKRRNLIQKSWNGAGRSVVRSLPVQGTGPDEPLHTVHRIKVDEARKIVITTHHNGGLHVIDLDSAKLLFELPSTAVRRFAHLEYSNGYLIFDCMDGDKEVWRLSSIQTPRPPNFDHKSLPHPQNTLNVGRTIDLRGQFEPYALLHMPEPTRAFRFVFPYLLVASSNTSFFCHVPSGRLAEIVLDTQLAGVSIDPSRRNSGTTAAIEIPESFGDDDEDQSDDLDPAFDWFPEIPSPPFPPTHDALGSLVYVDHSPSYLLLVGKEVLKVFERTQRDPTGVEDSTLDPATADSGSARLPIQTPPKVLIRLTSAGARYGRWKYILTRERSSNPGSALVKHVLRVTQQSWSRSRQRAGERRNLDAFVAAHISPCGNHLAILLFLGARLVIVPHFRRYAGQPDWEQMMYENALDIQLGSPRGALGVYLAYEEGDAGVGKIGVVSTQGVFVVSLPYLPPPAESTRPTRVYDTSPAITISRVANLMNGNWLWDVSCLMISDTGLYTTYCPTSCTFENPFQGTMSGVEETKAINSDPSQTRRADDVGWGEQDDEIADENNDEMDWEDDDSDDDQRPLINPQALVPQSLGPDLSQEHWEEQLAESLQQLEEGGISCYRKALEGSVLLRMSQGRTRSDAVVVCAVRFSEGIP